MENNIFYKLNEKERVILNQVSEITITDYEADKLYVPVDNLISALAELLYAYHVKEEELQDLEQDLKDNYKPIPYKEQV